MTVFETECLFCGDHIRSENALEHIDGMIAHDCFQRACHDAMSAGLPARERLVELARDNGGWRRIIIAGELVA